MPNFFSDNSPYLEHPLLTPERTAAEVDFVIGQLGLQTPATILDVGCAFGRHSIELSKRGFQVTGIDPADAMIEAAREKATEAGVEPTFVVAGAESYQPAEQFDAAIVLFTVLGQIEEAGDNRGLLPNVASALRPNGQLLVEVPQRDPYKAMLAPQDRFGGEETYTQITRDYRSNGQVLIEQFEMGSPEGTRDLVLSFRLFNKSELTELLTAAGFSKLEWFANYEGQPLQPESPFMLVKAAV